MKRRKKRKGGEERRRRGCGKGGYCVLDISDGHWASHCQIGSVMISGSHFCSSWSNFVDHFASKRYAFLLKNSTFHQIRTLMLKGPNFVKFFSLSFHKHFFTETKRQGPNYVNAKTFLFNFHAIRTFFLMCLKCREMCKNLLPQRGASCVSIRPQSKIHSSRTHRLTDGNTRATVAPEKRKTQKGERQPYTLSNLDLLDFFTQSVTLITVKSNSLLAGISFCKRTSVVVSSLTPLQYFARRVHSTNCQKLDNNGMSNSGNHSVRTQSLNKR